MTAPSIEMIAELLKTCSLWRNNNNNNNNNGRRSHSALTPPPPPPPPEDPTDESEEGEITLELNSDVTLPCNWEQCLDVRTGEVYYIDWRTGTRTSEDPRNLTALSSIFYSSSSSISSSSGDDEDDTKDTACSSVITSLSSHSSSDATSAGEPPVLVAAGCKACFMYFMVPKWFHACPKCGAPGLLHLAGDAFF
ncbi:hypothetical protein J5N97_021511 [Dioscorea zingiberensis]|uniref:WW domain-containing protein n=1 Tax=Dioscorea zingiberensis TaxID=325984 RepID=A0A9D5CHT9_9LILI|nr:hypothetical protein J5N97_021511 [Dioscorea zingiberensis]